MSGCKIGTILPHELPAPLQLWWQVMDGKVAVRAARQMSKFGAALTEQMFLCTNKFGKLL